MPDSTPDPNLTPWSAAAVAEAEAFEGPLPGDKPAKDFTTEELCVAIRISLVNIARAVVDDKVTALFLLGATTALYKELERRLEANSG